MVLSGGSSSAGNQTVPYEGSKLQKVIQPNLPTSNVNNPTLPASVISQLAPTKTPSRSGGSSFSSPTSNINNPTLPASVVNTQEAQQSTNAMAQKDIPAAPVNPLNTIRNFATETYNNAKTGVVNVYNRFTGKDARDAALYQESIKLQGGERQTPFVQSGRGTIVRSNVPYTEKELVDMGKTGQASAQGVTGEIQRRENEKYIQEHNNNINSVAASLSQEARATQDKQYQESTSRLGTLRTDLQLQVQDGKLSEQEANKQYKQAVNEDNTRLQATADNINSISQNRLNQYSEKWQQDRGVNIQIDANKKINEVSKDIALANLITVAPLLVAGGYVASAGLVGLAATGAAGTFAAETIGLSTGLVSVGIAGKNIGTELKQGTFNLKSVALEGIPLATGVAGGYLGARSASALISEARIAKLQAAIEKSQVNILSEKGQSLDFKVDLATLSKEEGTINSKRIASGSINAKATEYGITNDNPKMQKTLNKNLKDLSIVFQEVSTKNGNVIDVAKTGKIKIGGKANIEEDVLALGKGLQNPETGKSVMDSIVFRGKGFKSTDVTDLLAKSQEVSKIKQVSTVKSENFQGGRIIEGESVSFDVASKQATKGKPIKYEDYTEVLAKQMEASQLPSTKSQSKTLQKVKSATINIQPISETETLAGIDKVFETVKATGTTQKIPKPIEFEKGTSGFRQVAEPAKFNEDFDKSVRKAIKASESPTINVEDYPSYTSAGGQSNSILDKGFNQNALLEGGVDTGPLDLSISIKKALSSSARNVVASNLGQIENPILITFGGERNKFFNPQTTASPPILTEKDIFGDSDVIKSFSNTSVIPNTNVALSPIMGSAQTSAQIQKQIEQLQQPMQSPGQNFPGMPVPNINFPPFGGGFSFPSGGGGSGQEQFKQLRKKKGRPKKPKYTASLGAAEFSKPLKITRKQLEKLDTITYTGLEQRPVIELTSGEKDIRKGLRKVKF